MTRVHLRSSHETAPHIADIFTSAGWPTTFGTTTAPDAAILIIPTGRRDPRFGVVEPYMVIDALAERIRAGLPVDCDLRDFSARQLRAVIDTTPPEPPVDDNLVPEYQRRTLALSACCRRSRKNSVVPARASVTIAVGISVHAPYLKWVGEAIASVEAQTRPADEKYLLCDGCAPPDSLPPGWRVIVGTWGNPGPGRNEAILATECEWVCWLDADDAYAPEYLETMAGAAKSAGRNIAVLYPDLTYCDESMVPTQDRSMHPWSQADIRRFNFVPTPSCWLVEALRFCGGWASDVQCMDDWATIARCSASAWSGTHVPAARTMVRKHTNSKGSRPAQARADTSWMARRYAIVTLLAGRVDIFDQWAGWINNADLPPNVSLWVMDDSRNDAFSMRVRCTLAEMKMASVHYLRSAVNDPPVSDVHKPHARVAALYNDILPDACACSDLLLMLEDDVLPPLDGLRRLNEAFLPLPRNAVGVCTGVYPSRCGGGKTLALSSDAKHWRANVTAKDIKPGVNEIGMTPGGFTLFDSQALRQCLPMRFFIEPSGRAIGWDGNTSRAMHDGGWRVTYHGDVLCEHHVWRRMTDGEGSPMRLKVDRSAMVR